MSARLRTVIDAESVAHLAGLRELGGSGELLYFLVWRDIKVRYKQTLLGASWAILQPLMMAAVFTLFFGRVAGISSDGIPYPLFSFSGLLLWTCFAQGVSLASASLVNSSQLLTKVYFPRLVIPIGPVLASLVDLLVASPILVLMMLYYKVLAGWSVLLAPCMVLLALVTAAGAGLWLSALNVEYRDIRYVIPFFLQMWLFVTPVIYPASLVVPRLEGFGLPGWVFGLNPMAGAIEGFRWAMVGGGPLPFSVLVTSAFSAACLLISGLAYFRNVERSFADVV